MCVVGAGIAGLSAAIESARLHRNVVLVDSLPLIGGQMVHSLIGLFCGVFGNGPEYRPAHVRYLRRHFPRPGPAGDLHFQPGHTKTVYYNEVALGAGDRRAAAREAMHRPLFVFDVWWNRPPEKLHRCGAPLDAYP